MIYPLRQRHHRTFAVLGVLLPLAFVIGVAARRPVPNGATLPPELAAPAHQFASLIWERGDLFARAPVRVRLLRTDAGQFAVAFSTAPDFVKPDLLVYWSAGEAARMDQLPENATLLGAFGAGALPLPLETSDAIGVLILFSLADQEIVDVSRPFLGAPASLPASSSTSQSNPPARMPALQ